MFTMEITEGKERKATGLIAVSTLKRIIEKIEPDSSKRYQGQKATTFKPCSEGGSPVR